VAAPTGIPGLAAQGAATAQGISNALPTVAATTTPTAEAAAASDPMSGIFSLLMQQRSAQQAPAPVPAAQPMRRIDNRSAEEKTAETSQTPDFYRKRYGRSLA